MIKVRKAISADHDQIWEILHAIIQGEDVFTYPASFSRKEMIDYWCNAGKHTYVALDEDDHVVGTFFIQDNQPGLGAHVANAGYAVSVKKGRKGIGKYMGEYSLIEAKKLGYSAMQFNIVVKSNEAAVDLWKKIGFEIIGEIPDAFNHRKNGLTNAYIMYRKLT
jgi:ribosomal protein S18 acetylase RimI-like enzyme